MMQVNGGPAEPLAEGIEDMQIAYGFDDNGDGVITDTDSTTDEWLWNAPGDTVGTHVIANLRAIRITLVAKSTSVDSGALFPVIPPPKIAAVGTDQGRLHPPRAAHRNRREEFQPMKTTRRLLPPQPDAPPARRRDLAADHGAHRARRAGRRARGARRHRRSADGRLAACRAHRLLLRRGRAQHGARDRRRPSRRLERPSSAAATPPGTPRDPA